MRLLPLGLLLALIAAGCGGPSEAQVTTTEVRDGIAVQMTLGATHDGLSVEARIENQRTEPLVLRQDGCGYAGVAEVARTTHQPRGRRWSGSIQALKRLVLEDQATSEAPEPMTPERKKCVGEGSAETLTMKPGAVRKERWISRAHPSMLDVVGSEHAVARLKLFEPDETKPSVAVTRPVSTVANWKISYPEGRSDGQRFDTLLADPALRRALAAEPAGSWREAALSVVGGADELKAVSARYERAFLAVGDGKRVQLVAPRPADRVLPYPEAPADLPPGIGVIPEPAGYKATHDVLAGALQLPSGRLAVDSVFDERTPVVDERARPGAHPFRVTLAKPVGGSVEGVALATLVVSDRPTVRWRYVLHRRGRGHHRDVQLGGGRADPRRGAPGGLGRRLRRRRRRARRPPARRRARSRPGREPDDLRDRRGRRRLLTSTSASTPTGTRRATCSDLELLHSSTGRSRRRRRMA